MIISDALQLSGIESGFFTREGGYSTGIFSSLNCGLGSGDDIGVVGRNRAKVSDALKVSGANLVSAFQVHSADVAVVTEPFSERPKADGLVTNVPGLALGVLTADCGPILFADATARVIGACHAGWKGAASGITDATVLAMEKLGARRENIVAVLGPTISKAAYEVGPEFPKAFLDQNIAHQKYFIPSLKTGHYMFDLPAYLTDRLNAFGVGTVQDLALCTYCDEQRFFSYRRTTHRAEKDYGRLISAIALARK